MHNSCPLPKYACYRYDLGQLAAHHLTKSTCKISAWALKDFSSKWEKVQITNT